MIEVHLKPDRDHPTLLRATSITFEDEDSPVQVKNILEAYSPLTNNKEDTIRRVSMLHVMPRTNITLICEDSEGNIWETTVRKRGPTKVYDRFNREDPI
jgi:hypothetical protein